MARVDDTDAEQTRTPTAGLFSTGKSRAIALVAQGEAGAESGGRDQIALGLVDTTS